MKIGGLQRVSLIDYPGKISATVFTQGCNFACPYCHNPELVDPALSGACLPEAEIFSYLEKRRGKLQAVTITGGEPTIQSDLALFIGQVRAMGYLVKLDTNGSQPTTLKELIAAKLLDYIAMDIKAPLHKYAAITRAPARKAAIRQSIKMIKAAGIPYEFRTTVVKSQLSRDDILEIGRLISPAPCYALQRFIPSKPLDREFLSQTTLAPEEFAAVKIILEENIKKVIVR